MKNLFKLFAFIVVGSMIGGCTSMQNNAHKTTSTVGQYTGDALITSKVKTKLLGDVGLKSFNISVSTNHGVVSLIGMLPNNELRSRAIYMARSTKGVISVDANNLTIAAQLLTKPTQKTTAPKAVSTTDSTVSKPTALRSE